MGAIAESIAVYAQPLLDAADGSERQVQTALGLAQLCWNLALLPEKERDAELAEMRRSFPQGDDAFADLHRDVILPMIQRHREMFPQMPRLETAKEASAAPVTAASPAMPASPPKYPGTGRNDPCPCASGKKYKRCCGR